MDDFQKKKMQRVTFRNVDAFLDFIPEDERTIVETLRELVFDCIPRVHEKLAYNVPFYKLKKNICFIWPASVLWGNKKTYEGVRFGFPYGYLLVDESHYLDQGNRKQVYWKTFQKLQESDLDLLRAFIFAAVDIDQQT